jgi:hypothetical protein
MLSENGIDVTESKLMEEVAKTVDGDDDEVDGLSVTDELSALVKEGVICEVRAEDQERVDSAAASSSSAALGGSALYSLNAHYHTEFDAMAVRCLRSDGEVALTDFSSVYDASSELGISVRNILRVCRRLQKTTSNLSFRWLDEHDEPPIEEPVSVGDIKSKHQLLELNRLSLQAPDGPAPRSSRRSGSRTPSGEYNLIRRPGYPEELSRYIGRRFKKAGDDSSPEVFAVTHVCSSQLDPGVFYYRYYSLTKHPAARPKSEKEFLHSSADSMTARPSWADWVPIGAHTSGILSPQASRVSKRKRRGKGWYGDLNSGGQRREAFSDDEEEEVSVSVESAGDESESRQGDESTNRKIGRREHMRDAELKIMDILKVCYKYYSISLTFLFTHFLLFFCNI